MRSFCVAGRQLGGVVVAACLTLTAQTDSTVIGALSWKDYGGGPDNSHYSTAQQIDKSNVSKVRMAWSYPTRDAGGYVLNPIVVDNVAYVLARNTALVALDATTGKEIWVHENLQGISFRGINYWESKDRKDRRLLFLIKQQIQEIDALSGKSILTFGNNGYVDLRQGLRESPADVEYIQSGTGGKIFENLLILGPSTGDNYRSPHGDVRAYDVVTGKLAWEFHTLPRPGEFGYDTWPKAAYRYAGGLNVWGEITVDPERGIAYIPTAEASYAFYGADRIGQDLFANCIVAVDARTGAYKWHFQEIHHDLWDYDAVSAPQLATVQHDGKPVDVVAHAGKTGFLYVLNRETGEPIWPIEERPVPRTSMEKDEAWPTQPFPTKPPPFSRQSMTVDDLNPYLPEDLKPKLKERINQAAKGLFTPVSTQETLEVPGNRGGSNWGTTASDPTKGLVFVLSINAPSLLKLSPLQPTAGGIGAIASIGLVGQSKGEILYRRECQMCHGANRTGTTDVPSLLGITQRMTADEIRGIILNGRGRMPARQLSAVEASSVINYLTEKVGGEKLGVVDPMAAYTQQPKAAPSLGGPVVASGGAPAGDVAAANHKPQPSRVGLMDGPPYPPDVPALQRFFTPWNVMYDLIKPPWNTLTAYDLNSGTIMWQIPIGVPPGVLLEQRGIIVTATGLIFLATGDGKVWAFNEQSGKTLWSADLPGGSRGLPSMYETNGRQYLLVSATQKVERRAGEKEPTGAAARPEKKFAPAYVAFALPKLREEKH
jgi:quinoprotein glucose dehydrogenase